MNLLYSRHQDLILPCCEVSETLWPCVPASSAAPQPWQLRTGQQWTHSAMKVKHCKKFSFVFAKLRVTYINSVIIHNMYYRLYTQEHVWLHNFKQCHTCTCTCTWHVHMYNVHVQGEYALWCLKKMLRYMQLNCKCAISQE